MAVVAPLNDLIFDRITIQSDRSMAAGGLLRPGTVCRSSCYTFLPRLRPIRSSAVRFAADSPLEGAGFEPSVPRRLQAKTPRFGIVLRRPLSSCGSFHIDHRLSCHVRPLIEFAV